MLLLFGIFLMLPGSFIGSSDPLKAVVAQQEAADELELFLKVQPEARDTELIKKLIQRLRQQAAKG